MEAGGGWRRRAPRPHAATLFSSSLQLSAVDGLGGAAADAASLAAAAEARAEAAEAELEAARDRSLRLTADFDNFRKRSDAEKAAAGDAARASAVEALIPLADSVELLARSGLPAAWLTVVGDDHKLHDKAATAAMLAAVLELAGATA